jgi:sugar phosphate isomerase/epimerase
MAKKAKKLGIKFTFEPEPGDIVYNTETFLKLREEVGMEEIACNLDPGHFFFQGIDLEICIRKLGSAIAHVHVKDASIARSVVEYTGNIDGKMFNELTKRAWNYATVGYGHDLAFWKNFVYTLRMVGYEGVLSIENENTGMSIDEGIQKSVDFMKRCMLYEEVTTQWWDDYVSGDKE